MLMLNFLRNSGISSKKFKKGSRLHSLHYLISDVVEMAKDASLVRGKPSYLIYKEILFIRGGLQEAKERILEFIFERAWGYSHSPTRSQDYIAQGKDDDVDDGHYMVGIEEDVEILLRQAISGVSSEFSSLGIVGMTGIGKTTLARKVYNHPAVVRRFVHRAWVHASSELSRKELLMKLIQQVAVVGGEEVERGALLEKMEHADNGSLREMLYLRLRGKRYFIVFDMGREKLYYKHVLEALPIEDTGSRLLLTSQTENVTFYLMRGYCYIHKMKFLDHNNSWQLFLQTLFCSNVEFPKQLEKEGKQMLTKYCGLPLAIKEVGRQVAKKRLSGIEWEELLESTYFDAILPALEPCYRSLSGKVKSCFLHIGFFKEGTSIRAEKFKQVLVAERVLPQKEMHEAYLYSLISESIIEVKDMTEDSRIKNFSINAIFHRLSITKAEKELSFEIIRNHGNDRPSHEPRRHAICCSRNRFNFSTDHDKHIVSLFFYGGGYFDTSPSYWNHFRLLKILDLEGFGLKVIPETLGTLPKLTYMGLRNNYIQELPCSLGCLKNLEVLDIELNFTVEVPDITFEMDSLCHLFMSDILCRKPLKIDSLKNLRTLTYISVDNWMYKVSGLQMMTSLRKLGIEEVDGNSDVSKLFASLTVLKNLDCLILKGFRLRSLPLLDEVGILCRLTQLKLDGLLNRLPSSSSFPPNIAFLSLVNSSLDEDPMPVLEKLSKLYYLSLRNAYTGQEMVSSEDGFPSLGVLCIGELRQLRNVGVAKNGMPSLSQLEIYNCRFLEKIPDEMVANLEKLKMVTTKIIATNLRKSGLISKIRHVDIQP